MPSEILTSTTFPLKNIAVLDGGRAFQAELHTRAIIAGGAFTKTLREGKPTRPLLRADGLTPVGSVQLSTCKEGLQVNGRLIRSDGIQELNRPGVSMALRYKVIHQGATCATEVRLFSVALVNLELS